MHTYTNIITSNAFNYTKAITYYLWWNALKIQDRNKHADNYIYKIIMIKIFEDRRISFCQLISHPQKLVVVGKN